MFILQAALNSHATCTLFGENAGGIDGCVVLSCPIMSCFFCIFVCWYGYVVWGWGGVGGVSVIFPLKALY